MKLTALILFCLAFVHSALAFDPLPLEKADAKRILESMSWTDVNIIAIRQGVDANGMAAPIYATVVGLGSFKGEHHSISQTLVFDKDLDWHVLVLTERSGQVWNKNGYREIKPWAQW